MMKNIKLMADYECFALWDEDVVDNLCPDELPISAELKSRIYHWAGSFDATLNRTDPASSGFATSDELRVFDDEGKELWRNLIYELGDDYVVRYFSPLSRTLLEP